MRWKLHFSGHKCGNQPPAAVDLCAQRPAKNQKRRASQNDALLFEIVLLARLRGLEGLDQHRGDLEQVAADAVVGDLEDRRGVVLVDRDDALGLAHTGLVLDGAGASPAWST